MCRARWCENTIKIWLNVVCLFRLGGKFKKVLLLFILLLLKLLTLNLNVRFFIPSELNGRSSWSRGDGWRCRGDRRRYNG